jgi:hypothetical protein
MHSLNHHHHFSYQALSDGYMVPLRLAPAFFALVRGDADLSDLAVQLASSSSHMTGSWKWWK